MVSDHFQSNLLTQWLSDRGKRCLRFLVLLVCFVPFVASVERLAAEDGRPNIILVMADDQGWGETGYNGHPLLKTPNLDAMAASGLRLDRFYAGGPVCSPTRATVLTGRTHNRTGVETHGFALRRQERTLPVALQHAGYRTGHFGKWHLNGMRGPGVPILATDSHHPGNFGFDHWLSVTNFFDRDPILSRKGSFEEFRGDSSEVVIDQALDWIGRPTETDDPFFAIVWFGTPHSPFRASAEDAAPFEHLDKNSQNHYGELVAMDRSIGTLRAALRERNLADNTLVWFCSDNGGLPKITPETVGGLRGFKGSLYEGGLRVPCLIEWPDRIDAGRQSNYPSCTMDIFPTIADLLELPDDVMLHPQDGLSLSKLFSEDLPARSKPLVFNCFGETAIIDNDMKLIQVGRNKKKQKLELYDLAHDPQERNSLVEQQKQTATRLQKEMNGFQSSLSASIAGKDYAEGVVLPGEPEPRFWTEVEDYRRFFSEWKNRPEYESRLKDK